MSKITVRGIDVHYQMRGEGPDVVLIHGLCSSIASWYNVTIPSLVEAGFRVTAYDLRGHGLSQVTPTGYTSLDLAEDLQALLHGLGIERASFVGHSYGGAIAMHFALLNPDMSRGVVLIDSSMSCLRHLAKVKDWDGWDRPGMKEQGFTVDWFEALLSQPDMSEYLKIALSFPRQQGFRRGQGGYTPRLKKLVEETRVGYEFRLPVGLTEERLREISTPVLAVYGSISQNQDIGRHLNKLMPNCWPISLPGLGHFAALHDPEPIVRSAIPFLRDPERYVNEAKAASEVNQMAAH